MIFQLFFIHLTQISQKTLNNSLTFIWGYRSFFLGVDLVPKLANHKLELVVFTQITTIILKDLCVRTMGHSMNQIRINLTI